MSSHLLLLSREAKYHDDQARLLGYYYTNHLSIFINKTLFVGKQSQILYKWSVRIKSRLQICTSCQKINFLKIFTNRTFTISNGKAELYTIYNICSILMAIIFQVHSFFYRATLLFDKKTFFFIMAKLIDFIICTWNIIAIYTANIICFVIPGKWKPKRKI